ncbi:MAG: hypothetical protein ACYCUC_16120 [Candidatus Dormibacteria bacterium]
MGGPSTLPDLAICWRAYLHRFDMEPTLRFAKTTLGWVIPRVRTPEQADRWTGLVTAGYNQLRQFSLKGEACVIFGGQPRPFPQPLFADLGQKAAGRARAPSRASSRWPTGRDRGQTANPCAAGRPRDVGTGQPG